MRNTLGSLLTVVLLVLSIVYTELGVFGVGVPAFLILFMIAVGVTSSIKSRRKIWGAAYKKFVKPMFYIYLVFALAFAVALYISGNLVDDVRYLVSVALQVFWFPVVYLLLCYREEVFLRLLRYAVVISIVMLTSIWLMAVVTSLDFFTLRNASSVITSDGLAFLPDMFTNANRTARCAVLLLCLSFLLQLLSKGRQARGWTFARVILTIIIFSSFSRASIASMLVLWGLMGYNSARSTKKVKLIKARTTFSILLVLFGVGMASVILPQFGDRIEGAVLRITQTRDAISSERVTVENMTIRARTWAASVLIIKDNPLTGVGVSKSLETLGAYGAISYKNGYEAPIWVHGGFLKIALYAGLLGLVPLLLLLLTYLYKQWQLLKLTKKANSSRASVSKLGIVYLVSLVPINIGADSLGYSMTWFVLALLLALPLVTLIKQKH